MRRLLQDRLLRGLLRLAIPVIAVNVGMMLMGVVDILIVGHLSAEALAAVAVANVYFMALSMLGTGTLLGLDPLLSQAAGAGDEEGLARTVQRGVVLAALLALPLMLALLATGPILHLARQPTEIIPLAHSYAVYLIPSVLPFLLFGVVRQLLQVRHHLAPILWAILYANLLNAALNWVLVFGHLGMPALGVRGSAIATTSSRWFMVLMILVLTQRQLRQVLRPWRPGIWRWAPFRTILGIGLPVAVHIELEMGAFSAVALLMGYFGTAAVAAHQITLNVASLTFMVPLGLGIATSVLVGQAVGRGDQAMVGRIARRSLGVATLFMSATSVILILGPGVLAALYTDDPAVRAMAILLLPIAGIFQVFDGIQVTSVGVLRGLGDTRTPMLVNLIGFGGFGLGGSIWLAHRTPLGAQGLWWGLVAGLAVVAIILLLRVRAMVRRPIHRLMADTPDQVAEPLV